MEFSDLNDNKHFKLLVIADKELGSIGTMACLESILLTNPLFRHSIRLGEGCINLITETPFKLSRLCKPFKQCKPCYRYDRPSKKGKRRESRC
jgi:hypothetical protein